MELGSFLDWLLGCIRPVRLPPGDSSVFYFDMSDTILMSVRIPDLGMQTNR